MNVARNNKQNTIVAHHAKKGGEKTQMYDSDSFTGRLNQLFFESRVTMQKFAEKCGVSRAAMQNYLNGGRAKPDAKIVSKICKACSVTSDWLLGLSDVRTPSVEIQNAVNVLGLSEDAVRKLYELNKNRNCPEVLSDIIVHDNLARLLRTLVLAADEDEIAWLDLDQLPRELLSSYANKPIDFSTGIGSEVADFLAAQELTSIVRDIRGKREKERENGKWQCIGRQYNVYKAKMDRSRMYEELEREVEDLGSHIEAISDYSDEFDVSESDIAKLQQRLDALQNLMKRIRIASFAEWKRGDLVKEYEQLLGKE